MNINPASSIHPFTTTRYAVRIPPPPGEFLIGLRTPICLPKIRGCPLMSGGTGSPKLLDCGFTRAGIAHTSRLVEEVDTNRARSMLFSLGDQHQQSCGPLPFPTLNRHATAYTASTLYIGVYIISGLETTIAPNAPLNQQLYLALQLIR
ncbi:hypothetical protein N7462_004852 [Penicillium macrosclerotiorum]|uniref:uncharacterized protein n=1 Tax=Penicillium macrosclerotiorum TaxID=303699 RepID=UPI0025486870|nr:uncharacterized protein N7462_004852 [Penicillium macrosclerotiorum]KAJ5690460.1 hypothetical protein N7462_004852 [Penicillium macrosclerotiorum]